MFGFKKEKQNNITIVMRRDSVSMGDDVMAPHEMPITFEAASTLRELLESAAEYVPSMHDFEWEVMCADQVLGRLISGSDKAYQKKLDVPNIKVSALPEREIFCRQKQKLAEVSYFERIEVLYCGEYFSIDIFPEYRDIKTVIEKGETKITTMDEPFALSHGFVHRELRNYDKVLPIDKFEGLRIVRIPNQMHVNTEYIVIPKDKVIEELKKRAGITSEE